MNKFIAIVDAYSAANQYAPECKKRGYYCIHVQSTPKILPGYSSSFLENDFVENVIHDGDISRTLQKLKTFSLICLFPGIESGVELADQLSERLNLPTNGTKKSVARRNKFKMAQEISKQNLRTAKQIQSNKLPEIMKWVKKNHLTRAVLKPLHSAGTDNVIICDDTNAITNAFRKIIHKRNAMGLFNDAVLAQEFLEGNEYVVNTVSYKGKHSLVGVWLYHKKRISSGASFYDFDELITRIGLTEKKLVEYVYGVLDALGICYGPAHAEVMVDASGPVLIEIASRIDGMTNIAFHRECLQDNQIDGTLDVFLEPQKFSHCPPSLYHPKKNAVIVTLYNTQEGRIVSDDKLQSIKTLASFGGMNVRFKPGDLIKKTEDLFTYPGFISLRHENTTVLRKDYKKIRELEKEGLFKVSD